MERVEPGILLVDDQAETRTLLKLMLERVLPGASYYNAEEGNDALAQLPDIAAKHGNKSLVITDVNMDPGMDGDELVREMRSHGNEGIKTMPVLMSSGLPENAELIQRLKTDTGRLALLEYLAKPVHPVQLRTTVLRLLAIEQ